MSVSNYQTKIYTLYKRAESQTKTAHPMYSEQVEEILFKQHLTLDQLRTKLREDTALRKQVMRNLIYEDEQQFYQHYFANPITYEETNKYLSESLKYTKGTLYFGFEVVEMLFELQSQYQLQPMEIGTDQSEINGKSQNARYAQGSEGVEKSLKKCQRLDLFLLIAICKGYLRSEGVRKDRVRSFLMQMYRKNDAAFFGLSSFERFHQNLVERSPAAQSSSVSTESYEENVSKIRYFLDFHHSNKQSSSQLPLSALEVSSYVLRAALSLRIDLPSSSQSEKELFQQLTTALFEDPHHLTILCKNFRFIIEFFRLPFNEKVTPFYPQLNFIKILAHYTEEDINKMFKQAEVGLLWGEAELTCCTANIFKIGLTTQSFYFLKAVFRIAQKNRLVEELLRICENYLPKIFIFLKQPLTHYLGRFEKLFEVSIQFVYEMTLGPSVLKKSLFQKAAQKSIHFFQKECPVKFKHKFYHFLNLFHFKYYSLHEKHNQLFDEIQKALLDYESQNGNDSKNHKFEEEEARKTLNLWEWQVDNKVPLFSTRSTLNKGAFGAAMGQNSNNDNSSLYKGLYNIDWKCIACYMNSFIQCLFMTIEFRKTILDQSTLALEQNLLKKYHQAQKSMEKSAQSSARLDTLPQSSTKIRQLLRPTAQLQRLFTQLSISQRPAISPAPIKNISPSQFKNTYQQDTIEFGRSVIDLICKSSLENVFEGEQTNEIVCPVCEVSRFKKEPFLDLMLNQVEDDTQTTEEITKKEGSQVQQYIGNGSRKSRGSRSDKHGSLELMLRQSIQPEIMEDLTCDHCHIRSKQSKKLHHLTKLPNYLILTLKRFEYQKGNNLKKHYQIDLGKEQLTVRSTTSGEKPTAEEELYQIYAIIVHRGQSANSGHYYSFCREWVFDETENEGEKLQKQQRLSGAKEKMELQNLPQSQTQQTERMQTIKADQLDEEERRKDQCTSNQIAKCKWICFNDSVTSMFDSFDSVREFFDTNHQDTPYVLFYQKISHIDLIRSDLKKKIQFRQPLKKFIAKDNQSYANFCKENSQKTRLNLAGGLDWRKFGKVKAFTAYDFFNLTGGNSQNKEDDDEFQGGGGFNGGGGPNLPII